MNPLPLFFYSSELNTFEITSRDIFYFDENDVGEHHQKLVKGAVLRDVMNGVAKSRVNINELPVMFQKQEVLLWLFENVTGYEQKTRRSYVGGSAGMSFRIAKGVYLRSSAFRGNPVDTVQNVLIGSGCLIVTNKNIFFWSPSVKTVKISIAKIVSVEPFADGISIQKDGVTAKPMLFMVSDPWFAYNLISNLNLL